MAVTLRTSPFKRNRDREKKIGDIFSNASINLSTLLNFAITVFFTQPVTAPALVSQESIYILINVTLCLGHLTNFCYRTYKNEIGKMNLALSLLFLALFVVAAYFLFPGLFVVTSLLSGINLANQIAIGINLFFLLKNHIVPPVFHICKIVAMKIFRHVPEKYYKVSRLKQPNDDEIINTLLKKHFGSTVSDLKANINIGKLNHLITLLEEYVNKYQRSLFGNASNEQVITELEDCIKQTMKGNADSSYRFINKKIAFKEVKQQRLNRAKKKLESADRPNWKLFSTYCKGIFESSFEKEPGKYHAKALRLLDKESERQQKKIDRLSRCLP